MALSVIAANITTKVSAAVLATRTTNGNIYTCPASSYAEIQISLSAGTGTVTFSLDGVAVAWAELSVAGSRMYFNGQNGSFSGAAAVATLVGIRVGPSQVLSVTGLTGTGSTCAATGVQFINSP